MTGASPQGADEPAVQAGPDSATSRELGRNSQLARIGFAAVYAVVSLSALPWRTVGLWMAAILAWELISSPLIDRSADKLSENRATWVFAGCNFIGSAIFQAIAFLTLSKGSALGVALGATWLAGAFMNQFVYFSANRRLLWSCLIPSIAYAIAGPLIAYGPTLNAPIVSGLILLGLVAAGRFSLDHRAVIQRLADRQIALVDLERKLSVAIEASGDGLFEMDLVAGESHASPTWAAMLGYAPGELQWPARDWLAFVHPDDRQAVRRAYNAHFRGETPHAAVEQRSLCKDGTYKWVLSRGRLVARTPEGAPWRVIGTTMDLSERKALEQQLEAARDLAESANEAKSTFVANMSHEIRTPLNGVIGITGALARTELTDGQREMVDLVQSSGHVLDRLLTDILDQAKIEAGDFQLQLAPFDLRREIEYAAELMRERARDKGLDFRLTYGDAAHGRFEGDAVRLRQILSNLAANAIKFTHEGAVTIQVETAERQDGATLLRIAVRDTGIGFDAEAGKRLFSRFTQADGSITRRFGGSGLGLAICRTLAELMGGTIGAESEPGAGSIFTAEIPLVRLSGAAADETVLDDPLDGAFTGHGPLRILLAEDHPTNQRVVQLILEPLGVELTIVGDGREAVELFRPNLFDLILMDMQMPVMDGLTATREIRQIEHRQGAARTPIAMLTANAMDEHKDQALAAGADAHITKPITPDTLVAGIEAALEAQGANPTAHPRQAAI